VAGSLLHDDANSEAEGHQRLPDNVIDGVLGENQTGTYSEKLILR